MSASKQTGPDLLMGQRVNTPGPCTFALWPRQSATVISGHHLRSNQYLLVRVYDEEAARKNWSSAVIKPASGEEKGAEAIEVPKDLAVGKILLIEGTKASFFIPPTGIEVVPDESGNYVRDAFTLERLEYAILIDENGMKRYERGPQVVFPKPTEKFFEEDGHVVFRPFELNAIQGIHVKVIAAYEEGGKKYEVGEELFITGKDQPIYFPRQEHSLVSYDGRTKHFATAIPAGEARYVMERNTGKVKMVRGPTMLLPDPRNEVIVKRILTDNQCNNWYPGNAGVLAYNRRLRAESDEKAGYGVVAAAASAMLGGGDYETFGASANATRSIASTGKVAAVARPAVAGDVFTHGTTYTPPRAITLDTKFAGVPTIEIWTGYAAMVVSKSGQRRVEIGPKAVLLEYDETLEVLEMSTGKPKTTDNLLKTVFLRVKNNQVTDIVVAETADHVNVNVKFSLRTNFEGHEHSEKWFEVENYVKYLCDHIRSVLKSAIRKLPVEEFYAKPEDYIRDTLLGVKAEKADRAGMVFAANGIRVSDVEVLKVEIADAATAQLVTEAQFHAVSSNVKLARAQRELVVTEKNAEIDQRKAAATFATQRKNAEAQHELNTRLDALKTEQFQREFVFTVAKITAQIEQANKNLEAQKASELITDTADAAQRARNKAKSDQEQTIETEKQKLRLEALLAETAAMVQRFEAGKGGLTEALVALGNQEVVVKLAEALSVQTMLGGGNFVEVAGKVLGDSKLGEIVKAIGTKALTGSPSNGIHA
mgnify:FL=1